MGLKSVSPRHAVVGVVALLYGVTALVFAFHVGSPEQLKRLSGHSLTVAALGAGIACMLRSRSVPDPRTRTAWRLLGAAAVSWGLGQVVTFLYEVVLEAEVPFPSLADLGYLLAVPLFGAGLLCLTGPAGHLAARLRAVVDGLLISCAVLLVSWVGVLGPVAHSSQDSLLSKVILIAYPAGDVALVTLVAYVLLRVRATGVRPTVPVGAIGAAVAGFAIADSGYAYLSLVGAYASGSVIDAGWLGGFTVLFLAAIFPPRRADEAGAETRPLGMLLPYVFIVLAVVLSVAITEINGQTDKVIAWIRTLLILLMVVRQVLTLQEVSKLTRTLERRVDERTGELRLSQERFRAMVEHSSDVVSLIDTDGTIAYLSDSSLRVFGHDGQALLDSRFGELLDEPSRVRLAATITEVAQQPLGAAVVELRLLHGDGGWRQIETTVTNLLAEPAVSALVLNSRDVSERRLLENQLTHQAFHDPLTGLANRALFSDRVQHAVQRCPQSDGTVAVLFLDLDGFKEVNDSLGHASGDALLVAVAERISDCVAPADTIARLGGDEFAVLVEGATSAGAVVETAGRIREALLTAIQIGGHDLFVAASIGIASAGPDTDTADQLIRNADLAMYQAKDRADGEPVIYDPSMHASLLDRLQLEADLRTAIRENTLHVHYQPTFTLDTGALVAVEALVRWDHPERGAVPPVDFIPIAEQTGLIHDLGRFVLREACEQGQRWRALAPGRPIAVAVNISGRQMQRAGFHEEVRQVLAETGLPAEHLVLEMTESVLMDDTDASLRTLQSLKALGIRIAIDDFGTGYSSLSYLHRFPVDILKIDRSFVERLSATNGQESLVHSIVQLGQTLQLETIAEGIEDHGQLLALRRLGADMAQGYHFGRPGHADAVTEQLLERMTGEAAGEAADPAARAGIVDAAVEAVGATLAAVAPPAVPVPREPVPAPAEITD
jgi:diguanylate cyclase (GGDEF)-like protein/PAS domain S-box-containing protein